MQIIYNTEMPDIPLLARGKVRDIYDCGDRLLIVATDRISAFDVVFPTPIPLKGVVLTQLSCFWFEQTAGITKNHFITSEIDEFPENLKKYRDLVRGRSMLVKKAQPLPVECIVRGYLDGSAWREYQKRGEVCGIKLAEGLQQRSKLPAPIFTPTTKAATGHDENITLEQVVELVGKKIAEHIKKISLQLYEFAHNYLLPRGIVLSDTKFEFGLKNGEILLIDECLTPDSSRFWMKEGYHPGGIAISLDKQYVRDYVEKIGWNKTPPAPELPPEVVAQTTDRYVTAYKIITGRELKI